MALGLLKMALKLARVIAHNARDWLYGPGIGANIKLSTRHVL
jgi:hypothetical protein